MSYPANELIEAVKALPAERQDEVREFIGLLGMSEEIIAVAMDWITERLPDRYCAGDPRLDVRTLSWRLPILLSYPSGKGGVVGEMVIDARTNEVSSHTPIEELRARGRSWLNSYFMPNKPPFFFQQPRTPAQLLACGWYSRFLE